MFASLQGMIDLDAELVRYGFIPKAKKAKKPSAKAWNILEALCAFDIETTTIDSTTALAQAVQQYWSHDLLSLSEDDMHQIDAIEQEYLDPAFILSR